MTLVIIAWPKLELLPVILLCEPFGRGRVLFSCIDVVIGHSHVKQHDRSFAVGETGYW